MQDLVYIIINLIISITQKRFYCFNILPLFNIFLNPTKSRSRNIFYIIKNRGSILGSVYFNSRSFNKNNNFSKFLRKLNNFYKKRDQLDDWKTVIFR